MNAPTPEEQAAFDHFKLRPYQIDAVMRVRELYREGKRNVLLCAPTAAGKTRIAACVVQLTSNHGKRSHFVVDRENLATQASETFDAFGIPHGVIKQKHWRYRPYERAQVCSVQTLMRRGWPTDPLPSLIVVDECHTVYQITAERLGKRDTFALGLTATPFTKGLGKTYDALVNVETTNRLIEQGALVPYRIYSPSQPDMTGVKVSAGEWEQKEATKRALQVVGDCVAEYLKHGNDQKFICSAITVDHARELHRQFSAAGVQCVVYTSKEDEVECDEIVGEFKKPDSYIRGLITVSKATKGFDVTDVGCVIMARPLRKSLADHIQLLGRGLDVKDDPLMRRTFINLVLGEDYEDRGDRALKEDELVARCEVWPAEVPDGVAVITVGVDTQDYRFEAEVIGWGRNEESWSIAHEVFEGDMETPDPWNRLDAFLKRIWYRADGRGFGAMAVCIDSGGHHTQKVYDFSKERLGRRVWAIKGESAVGAKRNPVWPTRKPSRRSKATFRPVVLGVNAAKDSVRDRLNKEVPGPGYMHFPADRDIGYFAQLTSERVVRKFANGQPYRVWFLPPGRANEALDCRVYGYAALCGLGHLGLKLNQTADEVHAAHTVLPYVAPEPAAAAKAPEAPMPRRGPSITVVGKPEAPRSRASQLP